MLGEFKIAIDLKSNKEYFVTYNKKLYIEKEKKFYIFERDKISSKPLGNLFISFLNLDMNNKLEFKNYIFKYLFIPLLLKINPNIDVESEIHSIEDIENLPPEIILSEDEIEYYYSQIIKKYSNSLLVQQKDFQAIAELTYYKKMLNERNLDKTEDNYEATLNVYQKRIKGETYISSLNNYGFAVVNIRINYDIKLTFNNKLANNIPYYFSSSRFNEILFISIKELAAYRRGLKIQKCRNCNNYFIPKTAHKTIYCDEIYSNNKTCKQIGAELTHKRTLKNDKILEDYRKRYQNLAGEVSKSDNPIIKQMYNKYKTEGSIIRKQYIQNKITAKEFKKWMENFYIRKDDRSV